MLIVEEPPLIFFHIRKTAGNSVVNAFAPAPRNRHPLCLPGGFPHETVSEFVERVGESTFRRYRSFCFVRHPLDRFISQYRFMQERREKIPYMLNINCVSNFIDAIKGNVQVQINLPGGRHKVEGMATLARPQHEYVSLGEHPIAVSHVFRFEDIATEWNDICRKLDLSARPIETLNRSDSTIEIDDPQLAERFVSDYYGKDFDEFGYERPRGHHARADKTTRLLVRMFSLFRENITHR